MLITVDPMVTVIIPIILVTRGTLVADLVWIAWVGVGPTDRALHDFTWVQNTTPGSTPGSVIADRTTVLPAISVIIGEGL